MQRIAWGILVLMLNLSVMMAEVNAQDKTATPAEQYKALFKEYETASSSCVPLAPSAPVRACARIRFLLS